MTLLPPPSGGNGAIAPPPQIPPAYPPVPSAVGIGNIPTVAEAQAHLDRHADGSVPLTRGQLVCLRDRVRELETAARMVAMQRPTVQVQPAAGPVKPTAKKNNDKNPKARTRSGKSYGRLRLLKSVTTLVGIRSAAALLVWVYLYELATRDPKDRRRLLVRTCLTRLARKLTLPHSTAGDAVARLVTLGLLKAVPRRGRNGKMHDHGIRGVSDTLYTISTTPLTTPTV